MKLESYGSADSHAIDYRADIDGLRAIAVLAVIAFHLSPRVFSGGYLGVDIFFVLSGFLISSIIWQEIQTQAFSIVRFYDRRVRRIMPALLLLLVVFTPVAAALLLPSDLIGFGKSLMATLGFSANMYFWRDTDYFARTAEDKPLLHLWSLGVEEQFYIIFPLLLALLWRYLGRGTTLVVALLTLVSFASNVFALVLNAESTAFFLLPPRAWELGLGALLALFPARWAGPKQVNWISSTGALAVSLGLVWAAQPESLIPAALPAVAGVALLILSGRNEQSIINRGLQIRPLRAVGVVSYSLYLWHWPIIVFCQYYLVRKLRPIEALGAFLLMLACAWLSWRFVERPFRSKVMPIDVVRRVVVAVVALLAVVAGLLVASDGWPSRLRTEAALIDQAVGTNFRCPLADYLMLGRSRACVLNLPSRKSADAQVVLLGNSHAQMYAPLWRDILVEHGMTGLLLPANGCLPTVSVNITRDCIDLARNNLDEVMSLSRVSIVILGFDWDHGALMSTEGARIENPNDSALVASIDALIDQLERVGKLVILIGPIAQPGWDVPSVLSRQIAYGRPMDRPIYLPKSDFTQKFGAAIRHFEDRADIRFVRPDRVQCPTDKCMFVVDGRSLFADNGHIATAALSRFRAEFARAIPANR